MLPRHFLPSPTPPCRFCCRLAPPSLRPTDRGLYQQGQKYDKWRARRAVERQLARPGGSALFKREHVPRKAPQVLILPIYWEQKKEGELRLAPLPLSWLCLSSAPGLPPCRLTKISRSGRCRGP